MKAVAIILGGLLSGYVVSNLENKRLDEIIEDLLSKSEYWYEVIQQFIGETIDGIEGADSETLKLNIDAFVGALADSVEEFLGIEEFDDRIKFVEDKLAEASEELMKRVEKINKIESK